MSIHMGIGEADDGIGLRGCVRPATRQPKACGAVSALWMNHRYFESVSELTGVEFMIELK